MPRAEKVYGPESSPPRGDLLFMGLQQTCILTLHLILPVVVCRAAGADDQTARHMVALSLLVAGVVTAAQSLRRGPIGAGQLCPSNVVTAAYLPPALQAARLGGLALVFGMTLVGGVFEAVLSRFLKRLHAFITPEISAVVVLLIALEIAVVSTRVFLGVEVANPDYPTAFFTLGTCLFLSTWGRGRVRTYATLIALFSGFILALLRHRIGADALNGVAEAPLIALPHFQTVGWKFSAELLPIFLITALACALKAVGVAKMGEHLGQSLDREWQHKDHVASACVLTDGLGTALAGLVGTLGVNPSPACMAIAKNTGFASRILGFWMGGLFVAFALLPKVSAVFAATPPAVTGGVLVFIAATMAIQGIELLNAAGLDAVTPFSVGVPLILAFSRDLYPGFYDALQEPMRSIFSSAINIGVLLSLVLGPLLRWGLPPSEQVTVADEDDDL